MLQILDVSGAGAERGSLPLLDLVGIWGGGWEAETQIKLRVSVGHSDIQQNEHKRHGKTWNIRET